MSLRKTSSQPSDTARWGGIVIGWRLVRMRGMAQAFEMRAEQARHGVQQALLARAQGELHHRIHFGQPRHVGRDKGKQITQAPTQIAGGGAHGALHGQVMLAERRIVGQSEGCVCECGIAGLGMHAHNQRVQLGHAAGG